MGQSREPSPDTFDDPQMGSRLLERQLEKSQGEVLSTNENLLITRPA